jgi:hypothetical protein
MVQTASELTHSLNWSSLDELVLTPLLRLASQERLNQSYHRSVHHHSPLTPQFPYPQLIDSIYIFIFEGRMLESAVLPILTG